MVYRTGYAYVRSYGCEQVQIECFILWKRGIPTSCACRLPCEGKKMFLLCCLRENNEKTTSETSNFVNENSLKTTDDQNIKPIICVTETPSTQLTQKLQKVTLLQGSSSSKSEEKPTEINQTTISRSVKYNRTEPRREKLVRTRPVLPIKVYPDLDIVDEATPDNVGKPKLIHDIVNEICFQIQPKLFHFSTRRKNLDRLTHDVTREVLAIMSKVRTPSEFEYTFNVELEVRKKYSDIKVYEKLHTFDDVKNLHKKIGNKELRRKIYTDTFQRYRKELRCYRGNKDDSIDCD